jgi:hypothetical protein
VLAHGADISLGLVAAAEHGLQARERHPVGRHPARAAQRPDQLGEVGVDGLGRDPAAPVQAHQRRTAERLHGTYSELEAGHYAMLSHPAEVAAFLLERN